MWHADSLATRLPTHSHGQIVHRRLFHNVPSFVSNLWAKGSHNQRPCFHSTQTLDNLMSKLSNAPGCLFFLRFFTHDLRFPPLVATCRPAPKPILSWRGPKRPTPVLHLQLTTWSLLLVTGCKASTDVLVPAGFLTPNDTDKTDDRSHRQGGKRKSQYTLQTDTLQSSRNSKACVPTTQ